MSNHLNTHHICLNGGMPRSKKLTTNNIQKNQLYQSKKFIFLILLHKSITKILPFLAMVVWNGAYIFFVVEKGLAWQRKS
jgi:hypothetical protein